MAEASLPWSVITSPASLRIRTASRAVFRAIPWVLARSLPARFAVLPYLGVGTGMGQGELFGLAVDEVDFRHKVVPRPATFARSSAAEAAVGRRTEPPDMG